MQLTIRNTFAKVATLTYTLGTIGHVIGSIYQPPMDQMSNVVHGVVAILAGYAGLGFIISIKKVHFKSVQNKIVYGLILFHLSTSSLIHIYSIIWNTNNWMQAFDPSYRYYAMVYFALFAYFSYRVDRRLNKSN